MDVIIDRVFEEPNTKFLEDVEHNCKTLAELAYTFHAKLFNIEKQYCDLSDDEQEKWASIAVLIRCCDDPKYSLNEVQKHQDDKIKSE